MKKLSVKKYVRAAAILAAAVTILCCGCKKEDEVCFTVNLMNNSGRSEVTLSSGFSAIGNDSVFMAVSAVKGTRPELPSEEPSREGYEFDGWFCDSDCSERWDSESTVEGDVFLYAGWKRSEHAEELIYTEPVYSSVHGIPADGSDFRLLSVCGSPINGDEVLLTAAGLKLLESSREDVSHLLGYDIAEDAFLTSAEYDGAYVRATVVRNNKKTLCDVRTVDITARLKVENSTYETKAARYEASEAPEQGCVILAGSSSMENWSTSAADMEPITSFNVGIGGTTAEQWRDCLAERLVFPYLPRAVVFYVGINNIINAGCSGAETGAAVSELLDKVHDRLPDADIYYVCMNLIPGYMKYRDEILAGNRTVEEYAEDKPWITLIDAGVGLLKENGKPNSAYFLSDGLHMSLCGYTIWGREVRDAVITKEQH